MGLGVEEERSELERLLRINDLWRVSGHAEVARPLVVSRLCPVASLSDPRVPSECLNFPSA